MTAPGNRIGALILLMAISLVTASIPTEAVNGTGDEAGIDACCAHDADSPAQADTGESNAPPDEDCCPNGCNACFLSCCAGPVCSQVSPVASDPNLDPLGSVVPPPANFASAHLARIFHPPQA